MLSHCNFSHTPSVGSREDATALPQRHLCGERIEEEGVRKGSPLALLLQRPAALPPYRVTTLTWLGAQVIARA